METQEIIKQQFQKFCNKSIDELTAKEEDFLLELARE